MMTHPTVSHRLAARIATATVVAAALLFSGGCMLHHGASSESKQPQAGTEEYIRGATAYQNGDTDTAITELNQAVEENPDLTMAHVILGNIYRSRADYNQATIHYEIAVKLDPYDYENHYNLGITYQFLNRLQEAAGCYLRALQLKPTDLNSNMNLGLVYLALNQPDDALNCMRQAVQIDPNSAAAHINLGVVLDNKGDLPAAELEYRRAIELDPASTVTMMNLAGNLIRQGRGKDAVGVMRDEIKISDTTFARKRYGDALVLSGQDDDAYRQYAEALRRNPDYWQALNQTGLILIRRYVAGAELDEDSRKQALLTWKRSLDLNPNQPQLQALIDKWTPSAGQAFP
ncbi:MAG: tetratricopeptide repeat protein [Tepidisphaeraceae bacterium]|jgi:tetratricopeptide (TPR) repeat protein